MRKLECVLSNFSFHTLSFVVNTLYLASNLFIYFYVYYLIADFFSVRQYSLVFV